jgi:signal transduction histidine kinase
VFLGLSAAGLGDRFVSPVSRGGSPDPGVLIEAQSTEAVLQGDLLRPVGPLAGAALTFALGALGAQLLAAGGRLRTLLAAAVPLAPLPLAAAALAGARLELAPVAMGAGLGLAAAVAAAGRWRRTRRAYARARGRIAQLEALQAGLDAERAREAEARRVVAHELKTPLTSMKGLAQLLSRFELSGAERDRVAGLVVAESARLAQMVDALLDLERLGLRAFEHSAAPLDLSELCAARAASLGAGRALAAAIEPGLRVRGDRLLLERVLDNLVGNAFKFSPADAPVRLELRREGSWALLEVADRGPGVPEAERQRIFGRFARGSAQAAAPGLGLGLALVAEAAAWHRGSVAALAAPGGGALFRVRLPLAV